MEVSVTAHDNGRSILSITLSFPDKDEALGVARLLEAIARNQWWSSTEELNRRRGKKPASPVRGRCLRSPSEPLAPVAG